MPEIREHWMTRFAFRFNVIVALVLFVGVELTLLLIIAKRAELPVERTSMVFFVLPVIGLLPMAAGIRAYRKIKKRSLDSSVDFQFIRLVLSLLISLVTLSYATILIVVGSLLSILQVSNR